MSFLNGINIATDNGKYVTNTVLDIHKALIKLIIKNYLNLQNKLNYV